MSCSRSALRFSDKVVKAKKLLETANKDAEISPMTVVADDKKRVTLRQAKPGERYDVQIAGDGKFVLTRLEPVQESPRVKVRIQKRGPYSVGILGRPINEQCLKEALSEFP